MRKKKFILFFFVFALAVIVAVICFRPVPQPQVTGTLAAQDVVEIKRLMNREIRRTILPEWTWASLKHFPANLKSHAFDRIQRIDAEHPPFVVVMAGRKAVAQTKGSREAYVTYYLKKGANGWEVITALPFFGSLPAGMHHKGAVPVYPMPDANPALGR